MRRKIIFITAALIVLTNNLFGQYAPWDYQMDIGTHSMNFSVTNTQNTDSYANVYGYSSKDYVYRFTLSVPMEVSISHCGSVLSNTHLCLLNASRQTIKDSDYSEFSCPSNSNQAYLEPKLLSAGTYYVVSEGYYQNGSITTTVSGFNNSGDGNTWATAINIGSKSTDFSYSDTKNTNNFTNDYTYHSGNDVFYKFTLNVPMDITISHCGSSISDTYIRLLEAWGSTYAYEIGYNDSSWDTGACSNPTQAYLKEYRLKPGTYYVMSEGKTTNGNITTTIQGAVSSGSVKKGDILSEPIDLGTKSSNFSFKDTRHTYYYSEKYFHIPNDEAFSPDVFYKFTLSKPMNITITHDGSDITDTYIHLLNSSGTSITYNSDGCINGSYYSSLSMPDLPAGTYYIVSEGYDASGYLTTTITGNIDYYNPNVSSDRNYVLTVTPTKASSSVSNLSPSEKIQTIQYYDGLGRPSQQVQVGITPSHHDLTTIQEYDAFGRESVSWLPGYGTGNGAYTVPATVQASAKTATLNNDQKPYSTLVYENSPLNRISEQYSPGANWHNNGKSTKAEYLINTATGVQSCAFYEVTADGKLKKNSNGNYPAKQLYITKTTDEDGKNITYEFTDKLGRVLLTRQMEGNTPHDTYYVYDDYGQKRFMLSPLAGDALTATNTTWDLNNQTLKDYAYMYQYDHRNRCIKKKLPGADWVYSVYDKANRLILTQDGEQRTNRNWTFYKYDALGRVIISGVYTDTKSHEELCAEINALLVTETTGTYYGYSWNVLPRITYDKTLTVNHYDNYQHLLSQDPFFQSKLNYETKTGYDARYVHPTCSTCSAKGLLVGTREQLLGGSGEIVTAMYYDDKGRVVQTKSINHLGGTEKEYIKYNFSGQPEQKLHEHTASATGATVSERYTYTYDHAGRLTQTKHRLNNGTEMVLADNTYDELGRLKSSKSNNNNQLKYSYLYNIRSWLHSLSNTNFYEYLTYEYNGNIASIYWTQSNNAREYVFDYDNLSRITTAYFDSSMNENLSSGYSYDKQGNITSLYRYDYTGNGYNKIDNLTLTYQGNQLKKVQDTGVLKVTHPYDFKDYANQTVEYEYNANGAMKKDLNKGISSITYNVLNLPQRIDIKNPVAEARNDYTYSAAGAKLKVVQKWNPSFATNPIMGTDINPGALLLSKTTDYVGNKIYENGTLKMALTENGYYDYVTNKYYFYFQDHLGNNRMVADENANIIQSMEYDPFGMTFPQGAGHDKQPFKFGGKELDRMNGLNLYDFVARGYDPVIGRFMTMDPMAEKYPWISLYAYCLNNPVRFVDINGKEPTVYEAALMSKHVYTGSGKLDGDWVVSNRNTGLTYSVEATGFKSNLYEKTHSDGRIEYAYVTAGTDFTSAEDWSNNFSQLTGNSDQYAQSVSNATLLPEKIGGAELTFIGHSLGGSLAAANALATGKNATTFNAAALTQATKENLGLNQSASIFNVVVKGEILNTVQSAAGLKLEGGQKELKGSFYLPGVLGTIQRAINHSIETVIKKLEDEKKQ